MFGGLSKQTRWIALSLYVSRRLRVLVSKERGTSCVLAFELSLFLRLASHAFGVGSELNRGTNGGLSLSDLTHDMNGYMEFGVGC